LRFAPASSAFTFTICQALAMVLGALIKEQQGTGDVLFRETRRDIAATLTL